MQEKSFNLKLNMPTGCEITNDALRVNIAPAKSEKEAVSLMASSNPYVDTSVDFLNLNDSYFSGGGCKENGEVVLNTIDAKYNTRVAYTMVFKNMAYYYDGVRISWRQEPKSSWLISDGTTEMWTKGKDWKDLHLLNKTSDRGFKEKDRDVYFGRMYNESLSVEAICSGFSGRTTYISSINPIKRRFDVQIAPAKTLKYANVTDAESNTYTSAILDNRADINKIRKASGDYVTVTATNSNSYARLAGLEFIDKKGDPIVWEWGDSFWERETQFVKNTSNTNSITFRLTPAIIHCLGEAGMETKDGDASGSLVGQIRIRPVFEKYPAEVKILENEFGKFTEVNPPADGKYYIGDRIKLSGSINDQYKYDYKGVGHRYKTKLNDMIKAESGTIDTDNFNEISIQIRNKYNEFSPEFSKNDNTIIIKVKKTDVDGGKFDLTRGVFLGSERKENGEYYEYTFIPAGLVKPKIYPMTAYATKPSDIIGWSRGKGYEFQGNGFYHEASSQKAENVITVTVRTPRVPSYTAITGKLYNTDINLSTGRQNENPTIPAAGAIVCTGGSIAVTGMDGSFATKAVPAEPGSTIRYMVINNGVEKIMQANVQGEWTRQVAPDPTLGIGSVTVPAYVAVLGVVSAPTMTNDSAWFNTISVVQKDAPMTENHTVVLNGSDTKFIATVKDNVPYKLNGQELIEKVTKVDFLVMDGRTKKYKSKFEAEKGKDGVTWTAEQFMLGSDSPSLYTYGDVIYMQMTTDKKVATLGVEDGMKNETVYSPISSGYQFTSGTVTTVNEFEVNIPISADDLIKPETKGYTGKGFYDVPMLETFGTLFQSENFSLTVEKLPNRGIRIRFGVQ
ncbi:MAG: hypothetical protein RR413_07130, partial [Christensenellaceae bacterium]